MKMRFVSSCALTALLLVACGGDESPAGEDTEENSPDQKTDAGSRDAGRTKKDATTADDETQGNSDDGDSDDPSDSPADPNDDVDAMAAAPVDGGRADAGRRDAGAVDAGKADSGKTDAGAGSTCDTLTYESFGKSFMTSYCTGCHGGVLAQKNIHLDTLAGVVAAKSKVKSEVSSKSMPPVGSKAPTSAERTQLGQWIDCGPK